MNLPPLAGRLASRAGLSVLVLVPVFWLPRVVSSDLTSHSYNAWLAHETARGAVAGLQVVTQSTNVLFDLILSRLLTSFDVATTERIAVSLAVLAFFWGGWRFLRAVRGVVDAATTAMLLVVSHGWVLQQGLFNYYLAVAGSLWFLSFAWTRQRNGILTGLPFLAVGVIGNPLPPLWAVSVLAFLAFARRWPGARTWIAFLAAVGAVRTILALDVWPVWFWWRRDQLLYFTGADQLVVFSPYTLVAAALLLMHWIGDAWTEIRRVGWHPMLQRPAVQALIASSACVIALPAGFRLLEHDSLVSLIPQRQSLSVAVLALAAFGPAGGRSVRALSFAIAVGYFTLLHVDHRRVLEVEREVATVLDAVPDDARVIGTAQYRNTRVGYYQLVERACLGRCWSFANYEPSSGQFRLRAVGPGAVVMSDVSAVRDIHLGHYLVRPGDVPAWVLENCPPTKNAYCVRPVSPGDTLGGARR